MASSNKIENDTENIYCVANSRATHFKKMDQDTETNRGRKCQLQIAELTSVLTELGRLQVKAAVTVKMLWSLTQPVQQFITSQGITDARPQQTLPPGAQFQISGYLFQNSMLILILEHGKAQSRGQSFRLAYAVSPTDIQHIQIQLADRCTVFVAGQHGQLSVEDWLTRKSDREIFIARTRVQHIRDSLLCPPSPKLYAGSIVDQLNRLSILHREGELSDSEFSKAKKMLF